MNMVEAIIHRMQQACSSKNDNQLAKTLDISNSSIANWKARGTVPYEECNKVALKTGVSLDWLINGDRELDSKKQDLLKAWKNREDNISMKRVLEIKDAIIECSNKATTVGDMVFASITLYEFKAAKTYEDFVTVLNAND